MQELATAMFAAPGWMRVESVTVTTEERTTVVEPHELERYEFPRAPFTITLGVVPTRNA